MPIEIILRGSFAAGYTLVDTATGQPASAVFKELRHALTFSLHRGGTAIDQQSIDFRGRPLGPPRIVMKDPRA